jgi:magnesium chelatase family protein
MSKISGPLLDRIDLHIEVRSQNADLIMSTPHGERTASIRKRCLHAQRTALNRQACNNSVLAGALLDKHCGLNSAALAYLTQVASHFAWSGRSTHRVLKVARTIADLAQSENIETPHIAEAVQYRPSQA